MIYRSIIVGHVENRIHSYGTFTNLRNLQDFAASLAGDLQFEYFVDDAFQVLRNVLLLWNRPSSHSSPSSTSDVFIRVVQDYLDSDCIHLFWARIRWYFTSQNDEHHGSYIWSQSKIRVSGVWSSSLIEIHFFPPESNNFSSSLIFSPFVISHSDFLEIHTSH